MAPPEAQPAPPEHAAAPPPPSAQRPAPSEEAPLPGVGAGCCAGARACPGANAAGAAGPLVPPPAFARGFAAGGGAAASAAFTPFASRGAAPTAAATPRSTSTAAAGASGAPKPGAPGALAAFAVGMGSSLRMEVAGKLCRPSLEKGRLIPASAVGASRAALPPKDAAHTPDGFLTKAAMEAYQMGVREAQKPLEIATKVKPEVQRKYWGACALVSEVWEKCRFGPYLIEKGGSGSGVWEINTRIAEKEKPDEPDRTVLAVPVPEMIAHYVLACADGGLMMQADSEVERMGACASERMCSRASVFDVSWPRAPQCTRGARGISVAVRAWPPRCTGCRSRNTSSRGRTASGSARTSRTALPRCGRR